MTDFNATDQIVLNKIEAEELNMDQELTMDELDQVNGGFGTLIVLALWYAFL